MTDNVNVRFGKGLLASAKVRVQGGYIEVKGAPMQEKVRVPLRLVRGAVAQRANVRRGYGSWNTPVVVLVGEGGPIGRAVLANGQYGAAEEAVGWINTYLHSHGVGEAPQ